MLNKQDFDFLYEIYTFLNCVFIWIYIQVSKAVKILMD